MAVWNYQDSDAPEVRYHYTGRTVRNTGHHGHRVIWSIERFIVSYIELTPERFPNGLAPVQVSDCRVREIYDSIQVAEEIQGAGCGSS